MSSHLLPTRTRDRVLVDQVRESPVDQDLRRTRKRILWGILVAVVLVLVARLGWRFTADRPVDYRSDEDHFKYGSIGSEPGGSLSDSAGGLLPPYEIFKVLPQVCPEKLPGGYASLGLIFEPGRDLPIGVSRRFRLGFDQVGLNCAVCHTATIRDTASSSPQIVLGLGANQFDLQGYLTLLRKAGQDPRFNADTLLAAIRKHDPKFSWIEGLAYRWFVIPRTKKALVQLNRDFAWMDSRPDLGPGRVDTFNPYKVYLGMDIAKDTTVGTAHLPSLWNQEIRRGMSLHWDG
ncbi:MAG TPA: cytochrome c, partial [Actinomycetota bacterium]